MLLSEVMPVALELLEFTKIINCKLMKYEEITNWQAAYITVILSIASISGLSGYMVLILKITIGICKVLIRN